MLMQHFVLGITCDEIAVASVAYFLGNYSFDLDANASYDGADLSVLCEVVASAGIHTYILI